MKRRELLAGLAAAAIAEGWRKQSSGAGPCAPSGQARCLPAPSASCYGPGRASPARTASAAPPASALYPLELYAVTAAEIMHYLPHGHRAETRGTPGLRPQLKAAALGQEPAGAAPVVIVVAAEPGRLSRRYGAKAGEFTDPEAGHATQNILLQAVVRGIAAVPIGSLDGSRAAQTLALPPGQTVIYLIPVGFAA